MVQTDERAGTCNSHAAGALAEGRTSTSLRPKKSGKASWRRRCLSRAWEDGRGAGRKTRAVRLPPGIVHGVSEKHSILEEGTKGMVKVQAGEEGIQV